MAVHDFPYKKTEDTKIWTSNFVAKIFIVLGCFLLALSASVAFGATVITVDGGVQSCYQYGVDHITGTITFTGTSNQWQFGISSSDLTGYSNAPDVRYVTNGSFTTSVPFDIDFTGEYDGSIESYLPIETYRYYGYAQSDGFDYNDAVFTLQSDPCPTGGEEATTTATTSPMTYHDELLITQLVLMLGVGILLVLIFRRK